MTTAGSRSGQDTPMDVQGRPHQGNDQRAASDGMASSIFRSVNPSSATHSADSDRQAGSEAHYAAAAIAEDVCAVSYKGDSGFTLTTVLNFDDERVVAFASNNDHWFEQEGQGSS